MNQREQNGAHANSYEKRKRAQGNYIIERYIPFLDGAFTLATIALIAISAAAFSYQFSTPGVFILIGGVACGVCGLVVHFRHRVLNKRIPATITLVSFAIIITSMISIGATNLVDQANKDRESFNVIAIQRLISNPPLNKSGAITRFSAIVVLPDNTLVINPVSLLLYLEVINKKPNPTNIVGISLEYKESHTLWSWTKLCPIDLSGLSLALLLDNEQFSLNSADLMLETRLRKEKALEPFEIAKGWTAWECPDINCALNSFRIGVSDAAGVISWQTLEEPLIKPNLPEVPFNKIGLVPLREPMRFISSCKKN